MCVDGGSEEEQNTGAERGMRERERERGVYACEGEGCESELRTMRA